MPPFGEPATSRLYVDRIAGGDRRNPDSPGDIPENDEYRQ
jgi:hypothetical protein